MDVGIVRCEWKRIVIYYNLFKDVCIDFIWGEGFLGFLVKVWELVLVWFGYYYYWVG